MNYTIGFRFFLWTSHGFLLQNHAFWVCVRRMSDQRGRSYRLDIV